MKKVLVAIYALALVATYTTAAIFAGKSFNYWLPWVIGTVVLSPAIPLAFYIDKKEKGKK
jgi:Na+/pantothenate symporter